MKYRKTSVNQYPQSPTVDFERKTKYEKQINLLPELKQQIKASQLLLEGREQSPTFSMLPDQASHGLR